MNILKEKIICDITEGITEDLSERINEYEKEYPYDIDMCLIKGYLDYINKDYNEALKKLLFSIKHMPYDVDSHFVAGCVYLKKNDFYNSMIQLLYSRYLYGYYEEEYLFFTPQECNDKIEECGVLIDKESTKSENAVEIRKKLKYIQYQINNCCNLFQDVIRREKGVIGEHFYTDIDDIKYCGYYNTMDWFAYRNIKEKNLRILKGEMLRIDYEGDTYKYKTEVPAVIPILSHNSDNKIKFTCENGLEVNAAQVYTEHFNYYRVDCDTEIESSNPMVVGKPIKLVRDKNKKKLAISFFVDGLSQEVLEQEGMENIMPNTYRFFSKGMICKNCFSTSDWTYPSLAGIITGYKVPGHMMIHPNVNLRIPDTKNMYELFHDAGYFTADISGDWRSSETLGYLRGIDRYIAQHQNSGMHTEQAICNLIENIEAFKETNQYIWVNTGDLHDIADEFDLDTYVQVNTPVSERFEIQHSATSVKQKYSKEKRAAYLREAYIIDVKLQMLYDYLEKNYNDDEYVICIFGDHGQTYFAKPEEQHLTRTHSNVAFMTRGGGVSGVSEEYFSSECMPAVMCKLAGIDACLSYMDGVLPKTYGGDKESEFALTETIHPGDPYMCAIHSKENTFYLTTDNVVTGYGRLEAGEYKTWLYDKDNNLIKNPELEKEYIDYIKEHIKYILSY